MSDDRSEQVPMRADMPCRNRFCDGYGNIDVSPSINGKAWEFGVCEVGPHPLNPHDYAPDSTRLLGR